MARLLKMTAGKGDEELAHWEEGADVATLERIRATIRDTIQGPRQEGDRRAATPFRLGPNEGPIPHNRGDVGLDVLREPGIEILLVPQIAGG